MKKPHDLAAEQGILSAFTKSDGETRVRSQSGSEAVDLVATAALIEVPEAGADPLAMEATLAAQVNALDIIFAVLAKQAATEFGEYKSRFEPYMRCALKAQAQCCATARQTEALRRSRAMLSSRAEDDKAEPAAVIPLAAE